MYDWLFGALGVGLGALLTGIAGRWVNRDRELLDLGKQLRDELRAEVMRLTETTGKLEARISRLEAEVKEREKERDDWRAKFFDLLHEHRLLQLTHERLKAFASELCHRFAIDPPDSLGLDEDENKKGDN